jgi:hypothetical protein
LKLYNQEVGITGSLPLPIGAATEATLVNLNNKLTVTNLPPSGTEGGKLVRNIPSGTQQVDTGLDQPLIDAQLRNTPLTLTIDNFPTDASPNVSVPLGVSSISSWLSVIWDRINSIFNYLPNKINNRIPVDVESLSVSLNTASLEISNDVGNPVPISGTVNLGTIGDVATATLQTTGNTSLNNINTKLPSGLTVNSTRLLVDNSGVTQPVSAASLPLPTGAATNTTLQTVVDRLMPTTGTSLYPLLGTSTGANIKASAGSILNIYCCNL